jgi:hypothetical protein
MDCSAYECTSGFSRHSLRHSQFLNQHAIVYGEDGTAEQRDELFTNSSKRIYLQYRKRVLPEL